MNERFVWRAGLGVIPVEIAPPLAASRAPAVIHDTMNSTLNPANGLKYTSKRAYERGVRAAGCEIVGNQNMDNLRLERNRPRLDSPEQRKSRREAIHRAMHPQR